MTTETEIARYVLVASVLVVAVLYYKTKRTSGGTLTAGYFVLLGVTGQWETILAAAVFTAITYGVMRLVIMRLVALPRLWVYGVSIVVATTAHVAFGTVPSLLDLPGALGLVFLTGLYVTPGIITYDLLHQGIRKTALGLGTAIALTTLVSAPLVFLQVLPDRAALAFNGNIPDYLWALAALVSVYAALALRLARHLGTAGFIGAVFVVEIFRWDTILLVIAFVIVARVIVWAVGRQVFLTPRMAFQLSFVTGAIVCWTCIYWGARWGIPAAEQLNAFLLEPLILVGLMTADLHRVSVPRAFLGTTIGAGLVAVALYAASADVPMAAAVGLYVMVAAAVLLIARPALIRLFTDPIQVARVGRAHMLTTLD